MWSEAFWCKPAGKMVTLFWNAQPCNRFLTALWFLVKLFQMIVFFISPCLPQQEHHLLSSCWPILSPIVLGKKWNNPVNNDCISLFILWGEVLALAPPEMLQNYKMVLHQKRDTTILWLDTRQQHQQHRFLRFSLTYSFQRHHYLWLLTNVNKSVQQSRNKRCSI